MSVSLIHRISNALVVLVNAGLLLISLKAYAGNPSLEAGDYLLSPAEVAQRAINVQWLEQAMQEKPDYYEDSEALQKLAQNALKIYWASLARDNFRYDRYTPVVNGHFSSSNHETDYRFHITGSAIRFNITYSF